MVIILILNLCSTNSIKKHIIKNIAKICSIEKVPLKVYVGGQIKMFKNLLLCIYKSTTISKYNNIAISKQPTNEYKFKDK